MFTPLEFNVISFSWGLILIYKYIVTRNKMSNLMLVFAVSILLIYMKNKVIGKICQQHMFNILAFKVIVGGDATQLD